MREQAGVLVGHKCDGRDPGSDRSTEQGRQVAERFGTDVGDRCRVECVGRGDDLQAYSMVQEADVEREASAVIPAAE